VNRQNRRAQASQARSAPSVTLLRKQFDEQWRELQQLRNVLFAILKEQGRIRFSKRTLDTLSEDDGLEAEDIGEHYMVTYKPRGQAAQEAH